MRSVLLVVAVVLIAVAYVTFDEPEISDTGLPAISTPVEAEESAGIEPQQSPSDAALPSTSVPTQDMRATPDENDSRVINIGEPMDPDDPSTWPQSDSTEVINIGEPMDPDDPSTWPQSESTEVINIGEPMDPDDPSTWPRSDSNEVINIGLPMDPDDPSTWPQ